jgi:anti-anti-sigma factor
MEAHFKHIAVEQRGDIFCVSLRKHQMDEADVLAMIDELLDLVDDWGCRKMALSLGPGAVECLYSVFLAKLVTLRRHLLESDGQLRLCDASPETIGVFRACHLDDYFDFLPDQAAALASLSDVRHS